MQYVSENILGKRLLFYPSRMLAVTHNHNGPVHFIPESLFQTPPNFPTHGLNSQDDDPHIQNDVKQKFLMKSAI